MRRLPFVLTLAVLSLIALPLATPAQQVDDVYCEDDSHCGCVGGCQPGGWCMCGDLDETADLAPETPDFDLEAVLDDGRLMASDDPVPASSLEECDAYCRDRCPSTVALWLTAGYCYCVSCTDCF